MQSLGTPCTPPADARTDSVDSRLAPAPPLARLPSNNNTFFFHRVYLEDENLN